MYSLKLKTLMILCCYLFILHLIFQMCTNNQICFPACMDTRPYFGRV